MTATSGSKPQVSIGLPQEQLQAKHDHSVTVAQLELFIRLGNMADLDPNKNFGCIMNLGNALIEGNLDTIQNALQYYNEKPDLLKEHVGYLNRAFAHTGVLMLEPTVMKQKGLLGQIRTIVVLSVALERAGKIAFISSDPAHQSYVHAFTRQNGLMMMEPAPENPCLLLKQISRVIRIPDAITPPPFSVG